MVEVRNGRVRLAIEAPRDVRVMRSELVKGEHTPLEAAIAALKRTSDAGRLDGANRRQGPARLVRGYAARWQTEDFAVIGSEQIMSSPVINPATGAASRTFTTAGKIDVPYRRRSGNTGIIDHKSTSDDIEDPGGSYWKHLAVDNQALQYLLLQWQNGIETNQALWDVMRKPSISPKKLTKAEVKAVVSFGEYFDHKVSDESKASLAVTERETLEMYEYRLEHDCTKERPARYFQRRVIPPHGQRVDGIRARPSGRRPIDYRGPQAQAVAEAPGKLHELRHALPIPWHLQWIQPRRDSANWKQREQVHAELSVEYGKDAITFSSVRTFQACPRRYFYQYEQCLEKIQDEESEALRSGTIWHIALEAYFRALIEPENQHGNGNGTPANSAGIATTEANIAVGF